MYLSLTVLCMASAVSSAAPMFVWPVSGNETVDLPQSSPFGPRLQASQNFRYDFHRGIDIPIPERTPLVAVANGTVNKAGNYSYYTDTIVQIKHTFVDEGGDSVVLYSNYLHMKDVYVEEDQVVQQGQVVGTSGSSSSGFPHLHFELRKGGNKQFNCVNPWKFLPYPNQETFHMSIDMHDASPPSALEHGGPGPTPRFLVAKVNLTVPERELDFDKLLLSNDASQPEFQLNDTFQLSFNQLNEERTPYTSSSDLTILDNNVVPLAGDMRDHGTHDCAATNKPFAVLNPHRYNGRSYSPQSYTFEFHCVPVSGVGRTVFNATTWDTLGESKATVTFEWGEHVEGQDFELDDGQQDSDSDSDGDGTLDLSASEGPSVIKVSLIAVNVFILGTVLL